MPGEHVTVYDISGLQMLLFTITVMAIGVWIGRKWPR